MKPAASFAVVVPVWNGARYVADAIRSVQSQTLRDWTLLVVDDGSTDDSAVVAESTGAPVLRRPTNDGVLAARRDGFRATSSDAVVFLDADDKLRPDALARYAHAFDERPDTNVLYGDRVLTDHDGTPFGSERGALLAARPSGDVLRSLLRRCFLSTPSQVCIRRRALESLPWRTDLRRMADWYLYCALALNERFLYVGRRPVVEYRLRPDSMARSMADDDTVGIEELRPALDAVFSLPDLAERLSERERARARRAAEASAFAWKGQEHLRRGDRAGSRAYLTEALRRNPASLTDALTWALTLLPRIPTALRPWVGTVGGQG